MVCLSPVRRYWAPAFPCEHTTTTQHQREMHACDRRERREGQKEKKYSAPTPLEPIGRKVGLTDIREFVLEGGGITWQSS